MHWAFALGTANDFATSAGIPEALDKARTGALPEAMEVIWPGQ